MSSARSTCLSDQTYLSVEPGGIRRLVVIASSVISHVRPLEEKLTRCVTLPLQSHFEWYPKDVPYTQRSQAMLVIRFFPHTAPQRIIRSYGKRCLSRGRRLGCRDLEAGTILEFCLFANVHGFQARSFESDKVERVGFECVIYCKENWECDLSGVKFAR